jgi:hypothetical protein
MTEVLRIVFLPPETADHKAAGVDSLPQLVHALLLRHPDQLRHVLPGGQSTNTRARARTRRGTRRREWKGTAEHSL